MRSTYAKEMFTVNCENVEDIIIIAKLPLNYDIYNKVQEMNMEIENDNLFDEENVNED